MDSADSETNAEYEESLSELVNYLTPRRDNELISTYQNTTSIACPVCSDSFDYLIVCKRQETSLSLSEVMDLCVSVDDDATAYLFTHE
jgi:hypothetical protein